MSSSVGEIARLGSLKCRIKSLGKVCLGSVKLHLKILWIFVCNGGVRMLTCHPFFKYRTL